MLENTLQKIIQFIFRPGIKKVERKIGYKLVFQNIPSRYINGHMSWNMTNVWRNFGIRLEAGANYWTVGKVIEGCSTRFEHTAPEYQSWLGGYMAKLNAGQEWSQVNHFQLAIADQNHWLMMRGDPSPFTTTEGWQLKEIEKLEKSGYSGTVYEFGCNTHSDVGSKSRAWLSKIQSLAIVAFFNLPNPKLNLRQKEMLPKNSGRNYEFLKLQGYLAIFNVEENVKIVLYGNGTVDTFPIIKDDILSAFRSCEIVKVG